MPGTSRFRSICPPVSSVSDPHWAQSYVGRRMLPCRDCTAVSEIDPRIVDHPVAYGLTALQAVNRCPRRLRNEKCPTTFSASGRGSSLPSLRMFCPALLSGAAAGETRSLSQPGGPHQVQDRRTGAKCVETVARESRRSVAAAANERHSASSG